MFDVKKLPRIRYNAPVTLTFTLAALLVLVLDLITGGISNRLLFSVYRSSLADPLSYIRAFTHVLGHSGWSHYFSNMTYFLLLGPLLEEKYGSQALLVMMVLTSFVTGLVFVLLFDGTALLGASGIVFMMVVLSSLSGYGAGDVPLTALLVLVVFLGHEFLSGVFHVDDISQITHIVGGLMGGLMGMIANRRKRTAAPR